jgi:hypothetical protein
MATLLRYHSSSRQPFCEVALENGDRVLVKLEADGVSIKREARGDIPEEVLFLGSVDLATDICMALLERRRVSETTVLDSFLAVVSQFRSADDIKAAFKAVAERS